MVPLERWLPDAVLQAIATENKLSETAFVVPTGLRGNYQLRWFTPATEVPICGHATLAAGAMLLSELDPGLEVVVFDTHAGALIVRSTDSITVNSSGNPNLAQGGSGDVLSGYLAGLLAQPALQADPMKTLAYGVWQHCLTADRLNQTKKNWVVEDLAAEIGNPPAPE